MTNDLNTLTSLHLIEMKRAEKHTSAAKHALKIFVSYLAEWDLDFTRLTIAQAQEFQMTLITAVDIEDQARYAKSTVNGIISAITAFYHFLKKRKQIYANPFLEIERVKNNKTLPKNVLDEEKMNRLLSRLAAFHQPKGIVAKKRRYKAHVIAELMYSTGARIHEIAALKPEDVDLEQGVVILKDSKTGRERIGLLNPYAIGVLTIYMEQTRDWVRLKGNGADDSLLIGSKASLIKTLNEVLQEETEYLGYPKITSHGFRHAVGYHLLRAGCDIRYIQELLGHQVITSTQIYTKVDKNDLRKVLDRYHPRIWHGNEREDTR